MPTMKEIQVQKVHTIIAAIKAAKIRGDSENVAWNWARAYSYADCLQSCNVITASEASDLQGLAFDAKGGQAKTENELTE